MSKKSIIDVMGRAEAFRLMGEAVVAAAKKNKAAGVTTASHIDGRTVFVTSKDDRKVGAPKGFRLLGWATTTRAVAGFYSQVV